MNKHILTCAVTAALGGLIPTNALAVNVIGWDLRDFDGDGLRSDFAFFAVPNGSSSNQFGFTPENCINGSGGLCVDLVTNGTAIGTEVFATGFNFGGTGKFHPNITAGGVVADIDSVTSALTFSALNFGGTHPGPGGTQFFLAPDVLSPGTGAPGSGYLATTTDLGGGNYGIVVRYVGTINSPGSPFNGFQANWRIEGIMCTGAGGCSGLPPEGLFEITPSKTQVATSEAGQNDSFTVRLSGVPTADVTVTVTSSETTEATVSPAQLTFTPANFSTPQPVTVTGVDDSVFDPNNSYLVNLAAASSDTSFNGDTATLLGTNMDDEPPPAQGNPHTVTSMTITDGTFFMSGVNQPQSVFNVIGPNTNLVGGYLGNGGTSVNNSTPDPNSIVGFPFFGSPVNTYTALSNLGDNASPPTPPGTIPGGPVPTGTFFDGTEDLQMEISSWFANWNGTDFNQGSATTANINPQTPFATTDFVTQPGTGGDGTPTSFAPDAPGSVVCTGTTCTFRGLEWSSLIVGGQFNGFRGTWALNGTITISPPFFSRALVTSKATVATRENGQTDSFTVVLPQAPIGNVTVNVSVSDTAEAAASPTTLTFTPANFNVAQTVTITGLDDSVQDKDKTYLVNLVAAAPSDQGAQGYDGDTASLNGLNVDDEFFDNTSTTLDNGFFGCSLNTGKTTLAQRADIGALALFLGWLGFFRRRQQHQSGALSHH